MFSVSISGYGKTNLSSGKLGPVTVTVHMNKPEVRLQTGGTLTGIFFLKLFFLIDIRNLFVLGIRDASQEGRNEFPWLKNYFSGL